MDFVLIILVTGLIISGSLLIFYLSLGFNFSTKLLKKLNPNKKQILLKYKILYESIKDNHVVNEIFTEDDFKLFEYKKIQKIRKQKLLKINQTR
jgi:hypothetical protein